jgi:hypothetical protein
MNNVVRHNHYDDYVEHKSLRKKQHDLDARLRVVEKGKGSSTQEDTEEQVNSEDTFSFGKWNEGASFDWKELAEVTSKGKEAIEEDDEEESEDGDASEEEAEEDEDYDECFPCVFSLFGILMPKGEKSHLHEFHLDLVRSQASISFACLCPIC